MAFFLKNYQKRSQITRCFLYKNLHEIPFTIEKLTLFYTLNKDISLKSLIRVAALVNLITNKRPCLLRARTSSVYLKIRKGAPIGVKLTLRKTSLYFFLISFIWEVLPNIKNFKSKFKHQKSKQSHLNSYMLNILDPLVFPILKGFYFYFRSCSNLRMQFSFAAKSSKNEIFFNWRFLQLPL